MPTPRSRRKVTPEPLVPTPITDAAIVYVGAGFDLYGQSRESRPFVRPDVCRQLERENARLRADLTDWKQGSDAEARAGDEARAECGRLRRLLAKHEAASAGGRESARGARA